MTLLDKAVDWFNGVKAAPVDRKVADMISNPAGIVSDNFPTRVDGRRFVPGVSYFGIRLSGLHMVDARRFAVTRLPLCVCLAEFGHDGARRSVPFSIGPDVIRAKLTSAGVKDSEQPVPAWIELRDLTVVRPTPVDEGNVSLYAGLFSVPQSDIVRTLLNVVGTVGTALGQPVVGTSLKVAETVYDSFGSLLGLKDVEQVSAALIGNALTESGSGYLLIANVGPEIFDPTQGRVVGGRLHWPMDVKGGAAVVEFDHALLALEQYDTLIQKETSLAPALFQSWWSAVLKSTTREQASTALGRLQDAIAGSPDITESDRIALIGSYALTSERLAQVRWPEPGARGDRGLATPDFVGRLTKAQAALPKERGADGRALEAIADALDLQRDTAYPPGEGPFAAASSGSAQGDVLDATLLETAVAIRTALLDAAGVGASGARAVSELVNRAAQT